MSLDFSVDLSASIGQLASEVRGLRADQERMRRREIKRARVPQTVRLQGSGICPTPTAPFGINFGGPDTGFFWIVRRIIVGGLTWTTSAAGTGEVYVTGLAGLPGVASSGAGTAAGIRALADLIDQAGTLPNKAFYGNSQVPVLANESLVVVVNGGTAGQQYVASTSIQLIRTTSDLDTDIEI
jgi:hypothetical protein